MESGLKKISDIFQGEVIFTIPQYQRAYSWESPQWDEFYDDLRYHNSNQKYFFGTLLLKDAENEKPFNLIEVVDGQQRTTTIIIFINVLLYLLKQKGSKIELEIFKSRYINTFNRYKLRPIDADDVTFFHTYVLQIESETSSFNKPSQGRLYSAKMHFLKKLKDLDLSTLESFLDKIENAEILIYMVNNSAEASLIFETTNDRGKDLTNLEKIKSFLMYKAYLANCDATDLITRIFSRFSSIYKEIELIKPQFDENEINIVSEDQLTQYHFICYFNWGNKKDYQNYLERIKAHINNLYNKKDYDGVSIFIENYTKDLEDVFVSFRKLLTNPNEQFREISFLGRIAVLLPIIIQAYRKDISDDKIRYNQFMTMLSKYAFRVFSLKAKRTNDVDTSLNRIARDFKGNYALLESELCNKMIEACPDETFIKKLSETAFYTEYNYETRIYFLWKYENYKRTANTPAYNNLGVNTLFEQEDRLRFSAEHIHAQHSKYQFENAEINEEFAKQSLNSLGNLVLDSKSANSSKGKNDWDTKQTNFFSSAPLISQNELNDFLVTKVWDKHAVDKRIVELLKFGQNYWK